MNVGHPRLPGIQAFSLESHSGIHCDTNSGDRLVGFTTQLCPFTLMILVFCVISLRSHFLMR